MAFSFSWKKKDGQYADVESAPTAKEAKQAAYEKRGRRRGGWVIGEDSEKVEKFVREQNAQKNKSGDYQQLFSKPSAKNSCSIKLSSRNGLASSLKPRTKTAHGSRNTISFAGSLTATKDIPSESRPFGEWGINGIRLGIMKKLIIRDSSATINGDKTTYEMPSGGLEIVADDGRTLFSIRSSKDSNDVEINCSGAGKQGGIVLDDKLYVAPMAVNFIRIFRLPYEGK